MLKALSIFDVKSFKEILPGKVLEIEKVLK